MVGSSRLRDNQSLDCFQKISVAIGILAISVEFGFVVCYELFNSRAGPFQLRTSQVG